MAAKSSLQPIFTFDQMAWLESDWEEIVKRSQLHMNLLDPFIAFRRVLLNILRCEESVELHLLHSVSTLRKVLSFPSLSIYQNMIDETVFAYHTYIQTFHRVPGYPKQLPHCMSLNISQMDLESNFHRSTGLEGYDIFGLYTWWYCGLRACLLCWVIDNHIIIHCIFFLPVTHSGQFPYGCLPNKRMKLTIYE